MIYKAIIIEDEHYAAIELKRMLLSYPEIEILAVADSVQKGITTINELKPQFIFLDVNLNGESGFDVLDNLDDVPLVIFVTANDRYAIKAFQISAVDYILKPVDPSRLDEAVTKIKKTINHISTQNARLDIDKRIFIKDGEQCFFVKLSDIYQIESIGNYARVYFANNKPMIHKSLNYLEEKLPDNYFFRASRQFIVNINFIENVTPFFNNKLLVKMKNGGKVEISQRQSIRFKELMGI